MAQRTANTVGFRDLEGKVMVNQFPVALNGTRDRAQRAREARHEPRGDEAEACAVESAEEACEAEDVNRTQRSSRC